MEEISTDEAPPSIGPFSQAIQDEGRLYVSGQGPVDAETEEIVGATPREQTQQTLTNIGSVLEAAGADFNDVVKTTIFLTDMDDYDDVNDVYAEFFDSPYPARSAVQVVQLPIEIRVEIELVASV